MISKVALTPELTLFYDTLGPLTTNAYALCAGQTLLLFDAPWEAESFYTDTSSHLKIAPQLLFLTHSHQDHIADVAPLMRRFPSLHTFFPAKEHQELLHPEQAGLPLFSPIEALAKKPPTLQKRLLPLTINAPRTKVSFQCPLPGLDLPQIDLYELPGHTKGSLAYHLPQYRYLISGDTLMHQTYGRTDLPGGSPHEMERSLTFLFDSFAPQTLILPGHGAVTQLGSERWIKNLAL